MLKTLLKEVVRGLRGPQTDAAGNNPAQDPSAASERLAFKAADPAGRQAMAQALTAELRREPGNLERWCLLGDWHLDLTQAQAAEGAYRQALQLEPMHARSQEGLGLALLQLDRLDEAYLHLETAHKIEPMNAEVLVHWGLVDMELGNLGKAADKFQRSIERDPRNAHAWLNLGLASMKQGQVDSSIEQIRRAVSLQPDFVSGLTNLALALARADQLDEALTLALRATELRNDQARQHVVLADVLMARGEFAQVEPVLARAQALNPLHVGAWVALGKLHTAQCNHAAAAQAYERALQQAPQHPDAAFGLAEVQLLTGQWATAWELHEARRAISPSPVRRLPFPDWQGPQSGAQTVLVQSEQGLGDIILFASCLGALQSSGIRCVLEVRPRLQRLFERSFPGVQIVANEGNDAQQQQWLSGLPPIDAQVPIGSLPRWLRRSEGDFPRHTGYLKADPQQVKHWHSTLAAAGDGTRRLRIGLAWRGGTALTAKHQRSLALTALAKALHAPDRQLVCLQYGEVGAELAELKTNTGIAIHPGLSGYADIDDLAALTCACDLVVTVCSSQAHLCGALGRPGIALVPHNPSWRYGASGIHSPWYPSLRLARQSYAGDWHLPLAQAQEWLQSWSETLHMHP
jgi:tetratricopeptide (TPR) repeat protein